jgi:hypothetical protein
MSIRQSISAFYHRSIRPRHAYELVAYSGGVVLLLLLLSAWICAQGREAPPPYYYPNLQVPPIPWNELALADIFGVGLMALALFVLAPATVAATVAGERRTGTLDQLRTTPLDPLALVAGLVVGAPARFYLLCAGPMALHVAAGLTGVIPPETLLASTVTLAVGGAACMMLALTLALAPRQDTGGAFVALGVAAVIGMGGFVALAMVGDRSAVRWAFLHPAGALSASYLQFDGLWRHLTTSYWSFDKFHETSYIGALAVMPVVGTLFAVLGGLILTRAACRKIASPHLPLFGKPQAVLLFALVAAALILPLDEHEPSARTAGMVPLVFGLLLLPVLSMIGLFATPAFESWALALRRQHRHGAWTDGGSPHVAVWSMLAVFIALLMARTGSIGFPYLMRDHHAVSFMWGCGLAATLPIYMLFATTRFVTAGARWAFGVAIGAHLLFQAIGIGVMSDGYLDRTETMIIEMATLTGVVVPVWVMWRQRALRKRVLAGANA